MPSWVEVEYAARKLAAYLTPRCSVEKFDMFVLGSAERPEHYGFPRSYSRRPNWDASILRTEVSWVLWHTANHPARGGFEYRGLPKWELRMIADGNIRLLWNDEGVTSKLRHEWLTACAVNRRYRGEDWRVWLAHPLTWVCRHAPVHGKGFTPRSLLVASWVEAKKEWKGWHTPLPIGYGADGEMSYIDPVAMLDEVWDEDLYQGIKSSPERVFRAVVARTSAEALDRLARENAAFPVMPWKPIQGITQIMTAADLVAEGERMKHCVGGYVEACRGGRCIIVKLSSSTAELSADGYVRQHRGYKNSTPPAEDVNLLDRWVHKVVDPKQRELRIAAEAAEAAARAAQQVQIDAEHAANAARQREIDLKHVERTVDEFFTPNPRGPILIKVFWEKALSDVLKQRIEERTKEGFISQNKIEIAC